MKYCTKKQSFPLRISEELVTFTEEILNGKLHFLCSESFWGTRQYLQNRKICSLSTLRKKCPYSELFWSVFFGTRTEYGEIWSISLYLVRMRENTDQNNSKYAHFSSSVQISNLLKTRICGNNVQLMRMNQENE